MHRRPSMNLFARSCRSLCLAFAGAVTIAAHGQTTPAQPAVVIDTTGSQALAASQSPATMILEAIGTMPSDGTYKASASAMAALRQAIQTAGPSLQVDPSQATPSFCSGATYLVFVSVLARLNREDRLQWDQDTATALKVTNQIDGTGIWGRWNANGPGTARLFYELGLGRNFTSLDEAQPGDFLKIFWTEEIGAREIGHSVIYLGRGIQPDGEPFIRYWSSNEPNGYGIAKVPLRRIKRMLFSRLEHPEAIVRQRQIPSRDGYLAAMLKRSSTEAEMLQMAGLTAPASH